MDCSPPGSSVRGIFQARILSWMPFPSPGDLPDPGTKYLIVNAAHIHIHQMPFKVKVKSLSRVWFFATPWTVDYQAPPSRGFSRQECWSGLPFPSPDLLLLSGDLPDPGIKPRSPALQAYTLPSEPPGKPPSLSRSCPFPLPSVSGSSQSRTLHLGALHLVALSLWSSLIWECPQPFLVVGHWHLGV